MFNELAFDVTYLDLVSVDCGIFDESASNYVLGAARREYILFTRRERLDRVKIRMERVQEFIDYLTEEEEREREEFNLGMPKTEMFAHKLKSRFEAEKVKALSSAERQEIRRATERTPKRG